MNHTYYRKLEFCEPLPEGAFYVKGAWLVPAQIQPEPPAHRVEDETWRVQHGNIWCDDACIAILCNPPYPNTDTTPRKQRAKRIYAGQEALKGLEARKRIWGTLEVESERILASLKD